MATFENNINDTEFDMNRKKKSRKRINPLVNTILEQNPNQSPLQDISNQQSTTENSDLSYEFLINRAFEIMKKSHRQAPCDSKFTISLPPAQAARIGTRRTAYVNFGSTCKALDRQETQVQDYFTAELGTTASIDSQHQLIIRGRFQKTHLENIARSFAHDYVICKACRSSNTKLLKSDRLTMLQCHNCGSQRSVSTIKSSSQAKTNRD